MNNEYRQESASIVDIFKNGTVFGNASSRIRRSARSLQWRQEFQNKDVCNGILIDTEELDINQIPNPEESGIGTGGQVWPAAIVLSKFLEKRYGRYTDKFVDSLADKRICELGSGTGVLGIACSILGAQSITVTDIVNCLPLIDMNAQRYLKASTGHIKNTPRMTTGDDILYSFDRSYNGVADAPCDMYIKTFEWEEDISPLFPSNGEYSHASNSRHAPFDIVVISDCILPKLYPILPLVLVLEKLLSGSTCNGKIPYALISYEHRPYPDYDPRDEFKRLAELHGLYVVNIPMEEHHGDYCCEDIEIWEVRPNESRQNATPHVNGITHATAQSEAGAEELAIVSFGDSLPEVELRIKAINIREVPEKVLRIEQEPTEGVGCHVWPSSIVFCRYLLSAPGKELLLQMRQGLKDRVRPVAVELGAGCGLNTLVLHYLGVNVVATDMQSVIGLLERNVVRNIARSSSKSDGVALSVNGVSSESIAEDSSFDSISIMLNTFDWQTTNSSLHTKSLDMLRESVEVCVLGRPSFLCNYAFFPDLVVCSDLLYSTNSINLLHGAICEIAGPDTIIMLCNQMRTALDTFLTSYCGSHKPIFSIIEVGRTCAIKSG